MLVPTLDLSLVLPKPQPRHVVPPAVAALRLDLAKDQFANVALNRHEGLMREALISTRYAFSEGSTTVRQLRQLVLLPSDRNMVWLEFRRTRTQVELQDDKSERFKDSDDAEPESQELTVIGGAYRAEIVLVDQEGLRSLPPGHGADIELPESHLLSLDARILRGATYLGVGVKGPPRSERSTEHRSITMVAGSFGNNAIGLRFLSTSTHRF